MKKWFIVFLVAAGLAIGSIYIFIPSTIEISAIKPVNTFSSTMGRFLSNKEKINESMKAFAVKNDSTFKYKDLSLTISKFIYNGVEVTIADDKASTKSTIMALEDSSGSALLYWAAEIKAGLNPFNRIKEYFHAKKIKEMMTDVINQLTVFLNNSVNIYGISVKEIKLTDSILISTKVITSTEPTVNEIYAQIKKLEDYATTQNAAATDSPMLNVQKMDETHFQFMVGLPINKLVDENADIRIKRMPYMGRMFVAEIKGGPSAIKNGLVQLGTYLTDSKRSSPAIPYELLITNRALETDTTKWITKLYYPII